MRSREGFLSGGGKKTRSFQPMGNLCPGNNHRLRDGEFFFDQGLNGDGVSSAAGLLHDLPHEEAQQLEVAGPQNLGIFAVHGRENGDTPCPPPPSADLA